MIWSPPNGTQALIFDCDGTLADTMPIHFRAWTEVLAEHGLVFPEALFLAYAGMPSSRIIARLGRDQGVALSAGEIESMVHDKEQRYLVAIDSVRPIPVVLDIAARCRGVMPMAVASGGQGWVVRRTLECIGALDWFETIVGAEDTERHKPEPDVFLEAARRLHAEPARCVVFEDSDLGMEAARRAAMVGVDIRPMLVQS